MEMTKEEIKSIALKSGFKLKYQENNEADLNQYVYDFANRINSESFNRGFNKGFYANHFINIFYFLLLLYFIFEKINGA